MRRSPSEQGRIILASLYENMPHVAKLRIRHRFLLLDVPRIQSRAVQRDGITSGVPAHDLVNSGTIASGTFPKATFSHSTRDSAVVPTGILAPSRAKSPPPRSENLTGCPFFVISL